MSFAQNNRYWLNVFMTDFFENEKKKFDLNNNVRVLPINIFKVNIIGKALKREVAYFEYVMKKYSDCLLNYILVAKKTVEKHDILYDFFEFKDKCDKEGKIGLKDVKLDLIDLSKGIESYGKHYYLIACDIDKQIDFELIYGTLKVINVL